MKAKQQEVLESVVQEEEKEEEISGAQFLCETVIRSLTLEEAPDHRPLRRALHGSHKPRGEGPQELLVSPVFAAKILSVDHLLLILQLFLEGRAFVSRRTRLRIKK